MVKEPRALAARVSGAVIPKYGGHAVGLGSLADILQVIFAEGLGAFVIAVDVAYLADVDGYASGHIFLLQAREYAADIVLIAIVQLFALCGIVAPLFTFGLKRIVRRVVEVNRNYEPAGRVGWENRVIFGSTSRTRPSTTSRTTPSRRN